ncbi:MAG TPA: FecR family protein [Terriglobales bacterium]|nr:FecR family protein [Terriglobales bacterium]
MHRLLLATFVVFLWRPPLLAEDAGKVARVLPEGFITRAAATAEARVPDPVAWNDVLRTSRQGRMRLSLVDGSLLTLGSESELRVVKHDAQSQQSLAELLYGRMRARVVKMTKPTAGFEVRTPTAVVGAIGTEFAIDATRSSAAANQINTLADLTPGALPGPNMQQPTLADFHAVEETIVYGLERITGVRNIDPKVVGVVYLLAGEFTIVRRGHPPTPPRPAQPGALPLSPGPFDFEPDCGGAVDLTQMDGDDKDDLKYEVTGLGTSTGEAFQVRVRNLRPCPVEVFVPHGAVLKPKGFIGRVIAGILGGGGPALKDFQKMMTEGTTAEVAARSVSPPGAMHFAVPESGEATFNLRAFCLELEKLAPARNTSYKFASPKESGEELRSRRLISSAYTQFLTGQARPKLTTLDSLMQWSIWASQEKMDEKKFRRAFTDLVEKNMKAQKKWNKEAEKQAEAAAADLWQNVSKVLAATP